MPAVWYVWDGLSDVTISLLFPLPQSISQLTLPDIGSVTIRLSGNTLNSNVNGIGGIGSIQKSPSFGLSGAVSLIVIAVSYTHL